MSIVLLSSLSLMLSPLVVEVVVVGLSSGRVLDFACYLVVDWFMLITSRTWPPPLVVTTLPGSEIGCKICDANAFVNFLYY